MSKKRYLEAEMLKEFLRMGMKVGHIHTLRDVENYIDCLLYTSDAADEL